MNKEPKSAMQNLLPAIPEFNFENFVIGRSNRIAFEISKKIAVDSRGIANSLFIYGGSGVGKSHLLHAIGNQFIINHKNSSAAYTTQELFLNELVEKCLHQKNPVKAMLDKYENIDTLLFDDFKYIIGKPYTMQTISHILSELFHKGKQLIIASNMSPSKVKKCNKELLAVFLKSAAVKINQPDMKLKTSLIKQFFTSYKEKIPARSISYMAKRIGNIFELKGVLNTIMAYSKFYENKIDRKFVENFFNKHRGCVK